MNWSVEKIAKNKQSRPPRRPQLMQNPFRCIPVCSRLESQTASRERLYNEVSSVKCLHNETITKPLYTRLHNLQLALQKAVYEFHNVDFGILESRVLLTF